MFSKDKYANEPQIFWKKLTSFSEKQYGFRKNWSCINPIIEVTQNIQKQLEKKCKEHFCFLDFKEAIDTIDHKAFLCNLEWYGFRGKIPSHTEDYLANRTQYVTLNWKNSSMGQITTGVPQVSVMGPFFF